jgi:hypothetical protein
MIVVPVQELIVVNPYWGVVSRHWRAEQSPNVNGEKQFCRAPQCRPGAFVMNIALPALFALAGLCSVAAMWHAVASNLDAISQLRRRVAMAEYGSDVMVTLHEPLGEFDTVASVRRPRQVRVPAPKPVTHRLHQFTKARTAVA